MWRLTTSVNCAQVDLDRRVRDISCCVGLQNLLIRHDGILEDKELRNPVFDDWTDSPDILQLACEHGQGNVERCSAVKALERKKAREIRQCLIESL